MKTVKLNGKEMTSTKELGFSDLNTIAGGYVHYIHTGMWGMWEVIDDETGDVLSTEEDLCHAEWACNKYGVSSDGYTILAIGRPSGIGEEYAYGYTFYQREFIRECPYCGGHNIYWSIFWAGNEYTDVGVFPATGNHEGSSAEGGIFCADCDCDWSIFGQNRGDSGGDLTPVSDPIHSTKADAYTLKSGNYVHP